MNVLTVKECRVCRQTILITDEDGARVTRDLASREVHQCLDVPAGAELLIMDESGDDEFTATFVPRRNNPERVRRAENPCGC